ncbi:nicotinate-nucleotide adenylyltransferase [Spiroplasma endosymbiont of Dilophus febrilis]|uniref:nicotinate-nucleotide adenylyltransferase n=1 Tax=Spiroplasma endosymbiont of Dilophus febrilis TaxID=3066292 RepID=UPI00313B2BC9
MKIIIFGGSFDPIHNQHKEIMLQAYEQLKADMLLIVPAYCSPLKKRQLTNSLHRIKMINLVISKYPWMKLETCEVDRQGISYTIDTVISLQEKYGFNHQYYIIIGSDQANNLQRWHNIAILKTKVIFVIAQRAEYLLNEKILQSYNKVILQPLFANISSTKIRQGMITTIDSKVLAYINDNLLYIADRLLLHMDKTRYLHCLNVGTMAKQLANHYQVNCLKAEIAGVYHDITKQWEDAQHQQYLQQYLPQFLSEPVPTWHSKTGALYLEHHLGFNDKEILLAISNHTTAAVTMSNLDKIIFIADKISFKRNYPHIDNLRKLAFTNLDEAFKKIFYYHYLEVVNKNGIDNIGQEIEKVYKKFF